MESKKVYVEVTAKFTTDGRLYPTSFRWLDDQIYEIQRIKEVRRAASLRAGGVGMRYTCIIHGKESYLYYEENYQWFVECK